MQRLILKSRIILEEKYNNKTKLNGIMKIQTSHQIVHLAKPY